MSQALDRNREYMVLNYNLSPIAIATRDTQYLIQAGTRKDPVQFPMTLGEIIYVNSTSDVFKIGMLFFEPAEQEAIYKELRIGDWENILRADEIDDIILHPTTETLQKLISIQNHMYYDRVYAEYVMLKNSGCAISSAVEQVIRTRRAELRKGVAVSEIKISAIDDSAKRQAETEAQVKSLQDEIAELKALLKQTAAQPAQEASAAKTDDAAPKPAAKNAAQKPAAKSAASKAAKGTKKQEG